MDNVDDIRRIKHPKAHQLACTIDEQAGRIEIQQGKNITVLKIQPGPVDVIYRMKKYSL